jgi:diguanylate cyclase (GGDEF)-like protein
MNSSFYFIAIPFTALICYCILLILLLHAEKNKITRLYSLYITAMVIWCFGSLVMRTNLPPGPLFWNKILCIGLISIPVIFYNFTLVFTETYNKEKYLIFGYCSAIVFIVLSFFGLMIKDAYAVDNVFYYKLGPIAPAVAIWCIVYLLLAFVNMTNKIRADIIHFEKVKFVLYGLVLVLAGALLNLFPNIGKYPFDIAFNTINAVLISYSIHRYKFLGIKVFITRGILYSLYTVILTVVYIVSVFIVEKMLSNIIGYTTIVSAMVTAIVIAIVFQPIRNNIQLWIDRLFYKEKLHQREVLRDFSNAINNIIDINELSHSLIGAVTKGVNPERAYLLLNRGDTGNFQVYVATYYVEGTEALTYSKNHPIIKWLSAENKILTMSQVQNTAYFGSLWEAEKEQLDKLEAKFFIPIKFRDKLTGVLILSAKKGGELYTVEDNDMIFTMVNSAALALDNAQMYERAKLEAITDGLTRLYNHRYFHETLGKTVSNREWEVFSLAMIDVDMFKLYNDLYGHSAGDRALERIACVLKRCLRKDDVLARYGGEEFSVILPGLKKEDALSVVERLRAAVEEEFSSTKNISEFLTISIGIANYPLHGKNAEELVEYADTALYIAKKRGRNQCVLYEKENDKNGSLKEIDGIQKVQGDIDAAYFSAIYALAATIDAKDHYTYGHSENVSKYGVMLAKAAGFSEESIGIVKDAGLLHDIGKIGVPEHILTKPSQLTKEEFDIMKKHVELSTTIIKHVPNLVKVIPAIMTHHERWDGNGYPRGIKGESIPLEGRCLCIVDAFDAMTSDRPYRRALGIDKAILELEKGRGIQFDERLTNVFINLLRENYALDEVAADIVLGEKVS